MKRKIKIIKAPSYKQGGSTGDQQNYGLYRGGGNLHDYLTGTELSDQQDIRVTYPEVPREEANIEVEKGEYIVPSDMSALYKVGGKKHSKGGTPVFAQGGEYVISDYITMPVFLQEVLGFEGKTKRKKDNTIAKLLGDKVDAKDYNRLSKLIQDDANGKEVDQYALATARNRMPKYQEYVSKAALGGELSKAVQGKDFEIPEIGVPALSSLQETSREIETQMEPLAKVKIGGRLPTYQGDEGAGNVPYGRSQAGKNRARIMREIAAQNPVVITGTPSTEQPVSSATPVTDIPDWFIKSIFDEAKTEWGGRSATTGKSTVFDYSDPNRMYSDYKFWRDKAGRDFKGPEDFQTFVFGQIELEDPGYFQNIMTEWGMPAAGTLTDKLFGARTAAGMQWRPAGSNVNIKREIPGGTSGSTTPGGTPTGTPRGTKIKVTGKTDPLNYVTGARSGNYPWWTENILQTGLLAADLFNKEDIYPWEPALNFVYPQAVFRSPRQAISSVQSQAADLARNAAMFADPQRQRAITADIQARTIPGIIQAEEQINAQNQAYANQMEGPRSEIANRLAIARAESALRLKDKGTIVRAQSRKEDKDKLAAFFNTGYFPGRKEAMRTGLVNMMNQYFNVDPRTGAINFTGKGKGLQDDAMSLSGLGMNQAQAQALAQLASQFVPVVGQAGAADIIKAVIAGQRPTSGRTSQDQLLNYLKEYMGA